MLLAMVNADKDERQLGDRQWYAVLYARSQVVRALTEGVIIDFRRNCRSPRVGDEVFSVHENK